MGYDYSHASKSHPSKDQPTVRSNTAPWGILKYLLAMVSGATLLLGALLFVGLGRSGNFVTVLGQLLQQSQPEAQVDIRSIVIQQIRGASDLTTAVFTMEAVVPTRQDREIAGLVVGSTRLLYIARGETRAGVDLGELQAEDIQVSPDRIQIKLPPPKILDSKIDVAHSTVYDYDRGFLSLGPDVAPELQSLAEKQSLEKITAAACREGLLDQANERAEAVVSRLLKTAGYANVLVQTQPPAPGACPGSVNPTLAPGL